MATSSETLTNICGSCDKPLRNPTICDICKRGYHNTTKCGEFRKVTHHGKIIAVCKVCHLEANPATPTGLGEMRNRSSSSSSTKSTHSNFGHGALPSTTPTAPTTSLNDVLKAITANSELMNSFISTQKEHNAKIDVFMQKQDAENKSVNERLAALSEESHAHHAECAASTQVVQELKELCLNLQNDNIVLKNEIKDLRLQVQQTSQRDAQHDLVITGFPEEEGQNLKEVLIDIATYLEVNLTEMDIAQINRIKSTNPTTNQPRFIYVSLESTVKRNLLLSNFKEAQEPTASQVRPNLAASRFFINEWQSLAINSLYRKAKTAAARCSYKYAWYRSGKIRVRRNSDSDTILINCEEDLAKIVP